MRRPLKGTAYLIIAIFLCVPGAFAVFDQMQLHDQQKAWFPTWSATFFASVIFVAMLVEGITQFKRTEACGILALHFEIPKKPVC
jgi:hypothetical protein